VNSFLGLLSGVLRHNTQPGMRCRDAFRTNCLFHLRQVKEHLLADLGSRSLAANGKRLGRAPVEQPVIRAEGEDA
jgi:hypothetical protein